MWKPWIRWQFPSRTTRTSHDLARSVLESTHDAVITVDESGMILSTNPAIHAMFGFRPDEVVGQNISILMPPTTSSTHTDYLTKIQTAGQQKVPRGGQELIARRKDGSEFLVDATVSEFKKDGRRCFAGIWRNAMESRQAGAYLAAIVESSDDAIISKNLDGTISSWNAAAERIFGYSAEEMIGRSILLLIPPELQHEETAILEKLRRGGRIDHFETIRIAKDGRRIDISLTVSPIRDKNLRIIGASKVARDITEHKRTLKALRDSERLLRESQQSAHIGSWEMVFDGLADFDRASLRCSEEWCRIVGCEPFTGGFEGDFHLHAVHPDDRSRVRSALALAVRERAPYSAEFRILRPDGTERVVHEWDDMFTDEAGRPIRMLVNCQDITERKQTERELQRLVDRLQILRDISLAILSSRSPREIAGMALAQLSRLVNYWTAEIATFHFDTQEVEVLATEGILREWQPPGTRLRNDLAGRTEIDSFRRGETLIVRDIGDSPPSIAIARSLAAVGMRSFVLIPLRHDSRLFGSFLLGSNRRDGFADEDLTVCREIADRMLLSLRQALLVQQLESKNATLELLSHKLIRAQEEERRRISQELHDQVGQELTAALISLEQITSHPGSAVFENHVADVVTLIRQALGQIREISRLLSPSLLDNLGLSEALRALINGLAKRAGLVAEVEVDELDSDEQEIGLVCYRIAQEALTNAIKHSGCKRLRLRLHRSDDKLQLVIEDDGSGFDVQAASSPSAVETSLGLVGMRQRVRLIGGRIEIESRPGSGTKVVATVPAGGGISASYTEWEG